MEMVRHDYECVQQEFSLAMVVEDCLLKKFCIRSDLKKTATLRGDSGNEVCASFLWCESHFGSINEGPGAEALFFCGLFQWPEGHCSLRMRCARLHSCFDTIGGYAADCFLYS